MKVRFLFGEPHVAVWQATFEFRSTSGFPPTFRAELDCLVPRMASWDENLELWGTEDGDRVDVWVKHQAPVEARVQFDLRAPSEAFWIGMAQFAAHANTELLSETGLSIPPRLATLREALAGSRAARFVEDPHQYLNRLTAGGLDDV